MDCTLYKKYLLSGNAIRLDRPILLIRCTLCKLQYHFIGLWFFQFDTFLPLLQFADSILGATIYSDGVRINRAIQGKQIVFDDFSDFSVSHRLCQWWVTTFGPCLWSLMITTNEGYWFYKLPTSLPAFLSILFQLEFFCLFAESSFLFGSWDILVGSFVWGELLCSKWAEHFGVFRWWLLYY